MKKAIYILSFLLLILAIWVVVLYWPQGNDSQGKELVTRYGVSEGLELVEITTASHEKRYVVEDADGNQLFIIPLRNCLLDTRYRHGLLRFREQSSNREGYIDRQGMVSFIDNGHATPHVSEDNSPALNNAQESWGTKPLSTVQQTTQAPKANNHNSLSTVNLRKMAQDNPFYKEATKVLRGKMTEDDAKRRHMILNYCEHLRTAYTTKDIDFIRQVFSDQALIIVGNVVKATSNDNKCNGNERISYAIHSKQVYIGRLSKVFAANKKIDVHFADFHIMRHPTMDGIYGVTLRQQYKSDRYSDDGYLFLLWDFRNKSMPLIHVRTWQPASTISDGNDIINIRDFNLQ